MLDIHKLNIFLVAAETLNFTHAATQLNMTQPSISQHIQALESQLKTPLFYRTGRHLELTDAGNTLIPLAREAVRLSIQIDETIKSLDGDVHGQLFVGCSTTPGKYILPNLLARFHRIHPQVAVTCKVVSEKESMRLLKDGSVHISLSSKQDLFNPDTESHTISRDRILLIAPNDHMWAKMAEISINDLFNADFILREEDSGTYQAIDEALRSRNYSILQLRNILTLGSSEAIALAIREGLGVGFISEAVVKILGDEKISTIKIDGLEISRNIYISRLCSKNQTLALSEFWNFLISNGQIKFDITENEIVQSNG